MNTATLDHPPSAEQQQSLSDKEKFEKLLQARYGPGVLGDYYTVAPNRLVRSYSELGLTATELVLWLVITSFQYGVELPYPSVEHIASIMGKSYRTIERYIKRMETKGFLRVERAPDSRRGLATNRYDFRPLYDKIVALYDQKQATNLLDNNSATSSSNGLGSQSDHLTHMSDGRYLPTDSPTEVSAKMSLEESNQEDLTNKDGFESSKALPRQTQNEGERTDVQHPQQNPNGATQSSGNTRYIEPSQSNPQTTKQAGSQQPSNPSKPGLGSAVPAEATDRPGSHRVVRPYLPMYVDGCIREFSREFHDLKHLKSNLTQTANLYADASIDEYAFGEVLYAARAIAKEARGITKESQDEGRFMGSVPHINRMPYFFRVLRDQLAQRGLLKQRESEASS